MIDWTLILLLTFLSGLGDSQGFIHAANVWSKQGFSGKELFLSGVFFTLGIAFYWGAVRFMNSVGITAAEIQSLIWFAAVVVGIAIANGKFAHWQRLDQIIALIVVMGIGLLIARNGT